ncbi:MAG: symmetrical bis(5'-nucleosyl)-tetraphosphatase [Comamonadaceae bacterium]|nr:MAG: symmetrical bis(5'-nucleosyl)-tetraphosphatase [Comamonadaceae bacterium]
MAHYMIGDLQGCHEPLLRLLDKTGFSPSRDTLYLLGDLVNRGPDSLAVLRTLSAMGAEAKCLLGNHDLHLLAVSEGVRKNGRKDTLQDVLQAPDRAGLLDWLRHRQMAIRAEGWLMVHAGVLPQWDADKTMRLAAEVEQALRGDLKTFLASMYGNTPDRWSDDLQGPDRLRVIVNALTRLRFCTPDGVMEFSASGSADEAPEGYLPWFEAPGRKTAGTPIAFGHWSTLGQDVAADPERSDRSAMLSQSLPLDSGCVWGGCLTAARLTPSGKEGTPGYELIRVDCAQSQAPG